MCVPIYTSPQGTLRCKATCRCSWRCCRASTCAALQRPTRWILANELPEGRTLVWQKGPGVGSGRFGQVSAALRLPSAELLAVKQIFIQEELELGNDVSSLSLQRVQNWEQIERELDVLNLLQRHPHPNIVRFFGSERYGPTVNMFMEYLPAGSLSKLLKEFGPFDEEMVRIYVRDLVHGVAHLHELGVAHRDLKCANLLLADDERGGVKIADFGTAKTAVEVDLGGVITEEEDQEQPMETARCVVFAAY
ncbi:hypothetical protein V7S43_000844 [Phytophthora oleae]|uniref:Protein kinase domain-containing protein n=1 Tax=Phytophthora oleae TaxID=2107226 RepID=A0ABD3G7G5_9STRA